jgi:hypothetical protein
MNEPTADRRAARAEAARVWQATVTARLARGLLVGPTELPPYFVDRFAHVLQTCGSVALREAIVAHQQRWPNNAREWAELVARSWIPASSLDGWTPTGRIPPRLTEFGKELRRRWAAHIATIGLPRGLGRLPEVDGRSWLDLAGDSVFHPLEPAIPGANYFDMLDETDRTFVLKSFGPTAPVDFFIFMLQVHESVHAFQTGEPLLNEVLQGALWVEFLDAHGLWRLQRNSKTGRACSLEEGLVRQHPELGSLPSAGMDSAPLFEARYGLGAYKTLLGWSRFFDLELFSYGRYLRGVSALLDQARDIRGAGCTEWPSPEDLLAHVSLL